MEWLKVPERAFGKNLQTNQTTPNVCRSHPLPGQTTPTSWMDHLAMGLSLTMCIKIILRKFRDRVVSLTDFKIQELKVFFYKNN